MDAFTPPFPGPAAAAPSCAWRDVTTVVPAACHESVSRPFVSVKSQLVPDSLPFWAPWPPPPGFPPAFKAETEPGSPAIELLWSVFRKANQVLSGAPVDASSTDEEADLPISKCTHLLSSFLWGRGHRRVRDRKTGGPRSPCTHAPPVPGSWAHRWPGVSGIGLCFRKGRRIYSPYAEWRKLQAVRTEILAFVTVTIIYQVP